MAKFDYIVKLNGVLYEAGEEVPVEELGTEPVNSSETVVDQPLTKAELIEVAKELGLEVNTRMKNTEIEDMIKEAKENNKAEETKEEEGNTEEDGEVAEENVGNPVSQNIIATEENKNEHVNVPAEGNGEETGNEDNEDSSFLEEVINGNE